MIDALRGREVEIMRGLEKVGYPNVRKVLEDFLTMEGTVGPACWRRTVDVVFEGQGYKLTILTKEFTGIKGREPREIIKDYTIYVKLVGPYGRKETVEVEPIKAYMNQDGLSLQVGDSRAEEVVRRIEDIVRILTEKSFEELS